MRLSADLHQFGLASLKSIKNHHHHRLLEAADFLSRSLEHGEPADTSQASGGMEAPDPITTVETCPPEAFLAKAEALHDLVLPEDAESVF